ncbi:hypothetical protein EGM51_12755 [Verrucomicrobia bacterium S94]|nr:hypothetical protein EGM51_12755 [Verrucomicrobia bacterium S94]
MSGITSKQTHTAVLATPGMEEKMLRYARLLSDNRNADLHHIPIPAIAVAQDEAVAVAEVRNLFSSTKLNLLLSEWMKSPRAMQNMIQLTRRRGVTGIFFRTGNGRKIGRIVVAVGGGPNLYEQLWLANVVAKHHRLPVAVLNWADGIRNTFSTSTPAIADLEKISVQQLGMEIEILEYSGPSLVDAVLKHLRPDDLLVIGAPVRCGWPPILPDHCPTSLKNRRIIH